MLGILSLSTTALRNVLPKPERQPAPCFMESTLHMPQLLDSVYFKTADQSPADTLRAKISSTASQALLRRKNHFALKSANPTRRLYLLESPEGTKCSGLNRVVHNAIAPRSPNDIVHYTFVYSSPNAANNTPPFAMKRMMYDKQPNKQLA
ncbi:unnamed protein product [Dicrocoelium dendriticum]|nr:unnamed protein product [Dicrocoelium dendriticum]